MYSQNQPADFLPSGNVLCPRGGCRLIDPQNFRGTPEDLIGLVVYIGSIATYIIGALAVLFVIYGAFLFLVGGEKGPDKAKKVIINAIIAIIIAALSFTGIQFLINILNNVRF